MSEAEIEWRKMLKELLDVEDGLSNWEIDFLDSLNNRMQPLTDKQGATLEKIYQKVL
jgi:hypothetical protein